jgi:hypothetical protein
MVSLAGVAARADAQGGTGTIRGKVTNAAGQPLPNAQVFIVGTPNGAQTGADGGFTIGRVPAGTVAVRARLIGYEA